MESIDYTHLSFLPNKMYIEVNVICSVLGVHSMVKFVKKLISVWCCQISAFVTFSTQDPMTLLEILDTPVIKCANYKLIPLCVI